MTKLTVDERKEERLRLMIGEATNLRDEALLSLQIVDRNELEFFKIFTVSTSQAARRRALIEVFEILAGEPWRD